VLYNGSGVFSGESYPGGSNGNVGISAFVPLAAPSANVQVIETFIVHVDGAAVPGPRHRIAVAGGAGLGA
jgi:hypothetical protein